MTLLNPFARLSLVSIAVDRPPFCLSIKERAVSATPPGGGLELEKVGGMGVPPAIAFDGGRGGLIDFGSGVVTGKAASRACRRRSNSLRTDSLRPVAAFKRSAAD